MPRDIPWCSANLPPKYEGDRAARDRLKVILVINLSTVHLWLSALCATMIGTVLMLQLGESRGTRSKGVQLVSSPMVLFGRFHILHVDNLRTTQQVLATLDGPGS